MLDLKPRNADPETARLVTELVAVALGRRPGMNVLTSEDLRGVAELEAEKAAFGCETNAAECMAELAGALGAERVVFGSVGQLGDLFLVTLNFYDTVEARSLGRISVGVKDKAELPAEVDRAVEELLGEAASKAATGAASKPAPEAASKAAPEAASKPVPEAAPSPFGSPLFFGGAGVAGIAGVTTVLLSGVTVWDAVVLSDRHTSRQDKTESLNRQPALFWGAVGAFVVTLAGGLVASVPFFLAE